MSHNLNSFEDFLNGGYRGVYIAEYYRATGILGVQTIAHVSYVLLPARQHAEKTAHGKAITVNNQPHEFKIAFGIAKPGHSQ